jgi:hypothetical protein
MKTVTHRSKQALENCAKQDKKDIFESPISWSYRIFENKQTKEFHQFFKILT